MRLLSAFAVVLCLASPVFAKHGEVTKKSRPVKDSYLVLLNDGLRGSVKEVANDLTRRHGGKVKEVWEDAVRGFSMIASEKSAAAIAEDPRVIEVEEDEYAEADQFCVTHCAAVTQLSSRCNDGKVPWQMDRIDQTNLPLNGRYENCRQTGTNAVAYIIDSGVSPHGELLDKTGTHASSLDGRSAAARPPIRPVTAHRWRVCWQVSTAVPRKTPTSCRSAS
jgi:peptidase inhibitor I9